MVASLADFDNILRKLCRASLHAPGQNADDPAPCAQLMEEILAQGDQFVERHTQVPGTNEYRLNGDQLKLKYDVEFYRDGDQTNVYVVSLRVDGDQVDAYPGFVRAAEAILETANGANAGNLDKRAA